MRVTENSMIAGFLASIHRTRGNMATLQNQLATGRRVLTPSDDPEATEAIIKLRQSLERSEQFSLNVSLGRSFVDETGASVDRFGDIMVKLKEVATRARTDGNPENLQAFANQIDQLLHEAVDIGNTRFNGRYLFGGVRTGEQPFILAADGSSVTINPHGITGGISIQVGEGMMQTVNIDGQEAFLGTQIFDQMIQIRNNLRTGQVPSVADMNAVTSQMDHVLGIGGKAGAIVEALTRDEEILDSQHTNLLSLLSMNEDTDIADATVRYKQEELMLEAALNTSARLLPKSLLDYLR